MPKILFKKNWGLFIAMPMIVINLVGLYNNRIFSHALSIADIGQTLEEKGDIQGALEKYKEAVKINSTSAYLFALLGRAYHKTGDDEKALASYEMGLKRSPQHFWVHYLIGELCRDENRYEDAIKKFDELISMKDNWYASNKIFRYTHYKDLAYGQLGYCYARLGRTQESLRAYRRYLIENPLAPDRKFVEEYIERMESL